MKKNKYESSLKAFYEFKAGLSEKFIKDPTNGRVLRSLEVCLTRALTQSVKEQVNNDDKK